MPKVTKPKLKIWQYFNFSENTNSYLCIFCQTAYKKNATRMSNHLKKCLKIPFDILKIINKDYTTSGEAQEAHNQNGDGEC